MNLLSFLYSSKQKLERKEFIYKLLLNFLLGASFVFLAYYISNGSAFFYEQMPDGYFHKFNIPGENLTLSKRYLIGFLYLSGFFIWTCAVVMLSIKRLRDMGRSTLWLFPVFLPMMVYFIFVPWDMEWTCRFFFLHNTHANYVFIFLIMIFYIILSVFLDFLVERQSK
ncbi:MAG: DUF805 domain-containing protein [Proteobacteria bacterium]|nr:DUF805 domain-containing protein [Pseudomonadota bacterium]